MATSDEPPEGLSIVRVPAPARAPELMPAGPHRTAGRPYLAPSPPDQLHILWRRQRRAFHVLMTGMYLVMCTAIAAGGHLIPGLVMLLPGLYITAALALNRRRLVLSERRITLRHEPVPWPGNRSLSVGTIDEVFVVGPPAPAPIVDLVAMNRSEPEWLLMVRSEGQARRLYASSDQAQIYALQRALEDHLGLREPDDE